MEATQKEYCYLDVQHGGKEWHIETAWVASNGKPCWYEGIRFENCQAYFRIFLPEEVEDKGVIRVFRNEEEC